MPEAIQCRSLSCSFGDLVAVSAMDLTVPTGSVFAFLGPNGAGKTTTIRLLLGLLTPDEGQVWLNGHELRQDRREALSGVGAIIESPGLYGNLTGRENLQLAIRTHRGQPQEIEPLLDLIGLTEAGDRLVRRYSLGMRQRLALARALLGRPALLVLDEPTNGLDPAGIAQFRDLLRRLPELFNTTVFLSSHLLGEVAQTATHCALMKKGRIVFQGDTRSLLDRVSSRLHIELLQSDAHAWQRLASSLQEHGLECELQSGMMTVNGALNEEARANLLQSLLAEGHRISEFRRHQSTLEQVFFELTGDSA